MSKHIPEQNHNQPCTEPALGDLLGAYEMGMLEEQDRSRFEAHLCDCSSCLEDIYAGAVVSEELRANPRGYARTLAKACAAGEPSILDRMSEFLHRLFQPRVLASVGAVAVVALMLMVFQPNQLPRSVDLAIIQPLPYEQLQFRSGADHDLDQLLGQGMEDYASGNFAAAAASLATVWDEVSSNMDWSDRHQTALFLGLCLLLDDRPDEALDPLRAATNSHILPIAERGKWYLAQAHLLREDPQASASLLESLLKSPIYGEMAADQLQSVRQICDNL